jgi:uncharacterized protein
VAGERHTERDCDDAEGSGPLRLCIVSRTHQHPDDLIRFVQGPDGAIVPDLARRLPGRGVWVNATYSDVAAAVRQRLFARSLKRQVAVPQDLPALVERLLRKRVVETLSLANKAGLAVAGFAKVDALIEAGRAAVLLHASTGAADGTGKLDRKFKALSGALQAEELIVRELESAELSLAMGRANVVHAATSEGGASQRIVQQAGRLRRYRSGGA